MKRISGQLGLLLIKAVGSLPFYMLYILSDILYLVLFRMVGYRREVVVTNISNSFPEKSEKEVNKIATGYFKYLADLILEGLKMHSISESELKERMKLENEDAANDFFDKGKSILIVCAHYGNFEYGAIRFTLDSKHRINTVYKPLSNQVFETYMRKSRTKFGTYLVSMRETYSVLSKESKEGILSGTGLASDQAPNPVKAYWMKFLNQNTPVALGCETIAKKMDFPVVYGEVTRLRRGYYKLSFKTLFDKPKETAVGEITETFTKEIEACIQRDPVYWMWSHKRWKHAVPKDLPENQYSKRYPVG